MRRLCRTLVASFLVACIEDHPDPQFTIAATLFEPSDGGVVDDGGTIGYEPGGPFSVTIDVKPVGVAAGSAVSTPGARKHESGTAALAAAPLHALVTMDAPLAGVAGPPPTSVQVPLSSAASGSFVGSTNLQWPPGGEVTLKIAAAGTAVERKVKLQVPRLKVLAGTASISPPLTLPLCVESSTLGGMVAVHLDGATLQGSNGMDVVASLVPGACPAGYNEGLSVSATCPDLDGGLSPSQTVSGPGKADESTWASHATLVALPSAAATTALPTSDGTAAGSPPGVVITATLQQAPTSAGDAARACPAAVSTPSVCAKLSTPEVTSNPQPGALIELDVDTFYGSCDQDGGVPAPNVGIMFQVSSSSNTSVPSVGGSMLVVPSQVTTDGEGQATAQLVMPVLSPNGRILIVPIGSSDRVGIVFPPLDGN